MENLTTNVNIELLETKLVDIMEDFEVTDSTALSIVKEAEENSLILVKAQSNQQTHQTKSKVLKNSAVLKTLLEICCFNCSRMHLVM